MKIFYIFLLYIFPINSSDQLRFVFEIFRHGARAPFGLFDKTNKLDCFNQEWSGIQELTNIGKRQHFLIGVANNKKYVGSFLDPNFDPREIVIYSTNINRTIDSANSQLQGMYPEKQGPKLINEYQKTKAVPPIDESGYIDKLKQMNDSVFPNQINVLPVHIFETSDHFMALYDEPRCAGLKGVLTRNAQEKVVQDFMNKLYNDYGDKLLDLIPQDRGLKKGFFKNYEDTYRVLDTIISEYFDGRDMTQIKEKLGIDNMDKFITETCYNFFYLDIPGGTNATMDKVHYGMSKIFEQILKYLDDKIKKDKEDMDYKNYDLPKYVMYSAHDSTIGGFQAFMREAFDDIEMKFPVFASVIYLELYKRDNGTYYVKYLYNNKIDRDIEYDEFTKRINKVRKSSEEVDKFCGFIKEEKTDNNNSNKALIIIVATLGVLFLASVISLIVLAIKYKQAKKNEQMNPLNVESLNIA